MINFCDHLLPKTPPTSQTEPAVPLTHCKEMSTACGQDLKENSWHKIWVNMEMPKQFEYYNYYKIFMAITSYPKRKLQNNVNYMAKKTEDESMKD